MPELPDITIYLEAIQARALSTVLRKDWPSTVEAWEALRDRNRSGSS